jgi:phage shock protein E
METSYGRFHPLVSYILYAISVTNSHSLRLGLSIFLVLGGNNLKKTTAILATALLLGAFGSLAAEPKPSPGALIGPAEARKNLASDRSAVLLDVRTEEEFRTGHIPGAVLLPYNDITEQTAAELIPAKDTLVVIYCRSGRRSAIAAKALAALGYMNTRDLGGIMNWPYKIEK